MGYKRAEGLTWGAQRKCAESIDFTVFFERKADLNTQKQGERFPSFLLGKFLIAEKGGCMIQ